MSVHEVLGSEWMLTLLINYVQEVGSEKYIVTYMRPFSLFVR